VLLDQAADGFERAAGGEVRLHVPPLARQLAPRHLPPALYVGVGAVLGPVFLEAVARHGGLAVRAHGHGALAVGVVVRVKLREDDDRAAELAGDILVQAPLVGRRVPADDELGALRVGTGHGCELAAAFVVALEVFARAFVVAALVGASDAEPVELVLDDQGHARVIAVLVDGVAVDRAGRLRLERAGDAFLAEGVAARGCYRQVERRFADWAEQSVVDGIEVFDGLVVHFEGGGFPMRCTRRRAVGVR